MQGSGVHGVAYVVRARHYRFARAAGPPQLHRSAVRALLGVGEQAETGLGEIKPEREVS